MNHAIEVLKKEERELECSVEKYGWPPDMMHLDRIRQAITDLEEKDIQREMAKEGE